MERIKQTKCQKYIFKIHSSRLRKNGWKLTLPLSEARRNGEIISLADSQMLRWIDELNGITDADQRAREIKQEIRKLKKEPNSPQNRRTIKGLYEQLDNVQFKPDYMCLIIDKEKDYKRACAGFAINGVVYKRLLGTNGGIKNSTIVFVSERHVDELRRRIDNGRNPEKEFVPAKLEAYKALTCSASIPVSMPHGVLVVSDCETEFQADTIYLDDAERDEPIMEERTNSTVTIDASDGYGLMLPSLAERWSEELELGYTVSGVNTRFSYEKGMVVAFDYIDFAENVAGSYIVEDAWGDPVDIRNVELILTTSMVKLWDSYDSCEDYINNSTTNGYTFGIAKTAPKELENQRALNYQFIQSYELDDDDIDELITPTVDEINGVLGGDWSKAVLFLKGLGITEDTVLKMRDGYLKAMMIDHRIADDPFVQNSIYQLIHNRINEAKVGVLNVHGNYSIVTGDPYALCQSMFHLPVTGLLKSGEIYNKYWADAGSEKLACFRAPMTCHNNIRLVRPMRNEQVSHWFQYMTTCTVLNAWDTSMIALNGCDFDGDIVMLTDNPVLVRRLRELPALMCIQRKATKKKVTEEDLIRSNVESFGNDIGKTTNWITSMFEVQSHFKKGSEEYETLAYRIMCGQLYQQNAIDRSKGIVAKPLPRSWHDWFAASDVEDREKRKLYRDIVADKKPYFMRYIYPSLMRQYNTYIRNTNRNALREFQMTVDEMLAKPYKDLTEEQQVFLRRYHKYMPVGIGDCVMNKICRRIEAAFDGFVGRAAASSEFDYRIMKSGAAYTKAQFNAVSKLYNEYNKQLRNFVVFAKEEREDEYDVVKTLSDLADEFERRSLEVCSNGETLCDIVLDLCYRRNSTRKFAWEICSEEIVANLLRKSGGVIAYPHLTENGEYSYCGHNYSVSTTTYTGGQNEYCSE